ncbi:Carbonyl reductase [Apostichopus japonicus]|uniref:Carbonyl reductase n=1 Tax=Stichopus japonicus TaxID=307972 RepID=A0A2G8KGP1_STIJA|nr:Carbonyl reductase [Apostichopus japonicus]
MTRKVSGSNKGIGFACVRALCKQLKDDNAVYLTARNPELGKKAVADLEKEGLKPRFHQLDITKRESVQALRDHLKKEHGGLDILINNAGFAYKMNDTTPGPEQSKVSCEINYFGSAMVFEVLSPILRSNARVVNVSSLSAQSAYDTLGEPVKEAFRNAATREELDALVNKYVAVVASGEAEKHGFTPSTRYGFSKLGLSALTRIQNSEVQKDSSRPGINVYSVCPGYVATDMSSYKGHKTPDEGAVTLVWLALRPQGDKTGAGEFYSDGKVSKIFK